MPRRAAIPFALLVYALLASPAQAQTGNLTQMLDQYRAAAQADLGRVIDRRGRVSLRVHRRLFKVAGSARRQLAATPVARPEETAGRTCAIAAFARLRSAARWGIRAGKARGAKRRRSLRARATRLARDGRARLNACVIPPPAPTIEIRAFAPSEPADELPSNGAPPGATLSACRRIDPLWATFRWRDFPAGTVLTVRWRGAESFDATKTLATTAGVDSTGLVATDAAGSPVALNNGTYTLTLERDGQAVARAEIRRNCS